MPIIEFLLQIEIFDDFSKETPQYGRNRSFQQLKSNQPRVSHH